MYKVLLINKLIYHILIKTKTIFVRTTHQNDLMVYQDALSLFVAKESYNYMREKGCYDHLIIPNNGSSNGAVYADRMIGVRSETMPLDLHLDQDLHARVD